LIANFAFAEKCAALVIKISNARPAPRLTNPSRDAEAVSDRPPFKSRERLL
jgi:hypothetical protein